MHFMHIVHLAAAWSHPHWRLLLPVYHHFGLGTIATAAVAIGASAAVTERRWLQQRYQAASAGRSARSHSS